MTYSDENLYKMLLSLAHNLRHAHNRRESGFPAAAPCGMEHFPASRARFDPRRQMPPHGSFRDTGRDLPPEGAAPFRRQHSHSSHDHRPPLARERILRLIGEWEPISQTALADHLAIRPQSLSEQLAKLEMMALSSEALTNGINGSCWFP